MTDLLLTLRSSLFDLIPLLSMVIFGYIIGYFCRKRNITIPYTSNAQTIFVFIIILFMGMRIGSNEQVIGDLKIIGLAAFLFTIFVQGISIIVLSFGRKLLKFDRYGIRHEKGEKFDDKNESSEVKTGKPKINMMTVYTFIAAVLGMVIGYFIILNFTKKGIIFGGDVSIFDGIAGNVIMILLYLLLVFVGHDLGRDENTIGNVKKAGSYVMLFPVFTVIGVFIGSIITALILKYDIIKSLAVGSGFGWYSLAPGILSKFHLDDASAISFLHNVMREILAIYTIPIVAKKIGYVETTCLAGAAGMDVCLPIVESSTSPLCAIYSFVSGVILTTLVPIFVTFFASIVVTG